MSDVEHFWWLKEIQTPCTINSASSFVHLYHEEKTQELSLNYNFMITQSLRQHLNMHYGEIWSADRAETTLRTQWVTSACSALETIQKFSWCTVVSLRLLGRFNRGGCHTRGRWLDALRMQNIADWPHMIITCSELSWFALRTPPPPPPPV